MNDNEQFSHFLKKLKERLTVIFDFSIPQGTPLIEKDINLLHTLYRVYYNGEIEHLSKEPLRQEKKVVQGEMFKAMSDSLPLVKSDEVSCNKGEKPSGTDIDNSKANNKK